MKHYFKIFIQLIKINVAVFVTYRGNFINDLSTSIIWASFQLFSMLLLTAHSKMVFGWSRDELLILTAILGFVQGFFNIFLTRNFKRFPELIEYGDIDKMLLLPIDSQFTISTRNIRPSGLARIIMGVGIFVYMISHHIIFLTPASVTITLFLCIFGILLTYSLWFIFLTLLIWFPRVANLFDLMVTYSSFARYPSEMYLQTKNVLWYLVLPVVITITIPTRFILGKGSILDGLILMGSALLFFKISRIFWRFALRSYTSASS